MRPAGAIRPRRRNTPPALALSSALSEGPAVGGGIEPAVKDLVERIAGETASWPGGPRNALIFPREGEGIFMGSLAPSTYARRYSFLRVASAGMKGWEKAVSDLGGVGTMYVFELNRQARTCKDACDRTLTLGEALRTGRKLKAAEFDELTERVEQAVSCAASMRNLIFGSANPRDKELVPFWENRIRWIQKLMEDPSLPTIKNVAARNSLEHFDERMDSWAHAALNRPAEEEGWVGAFDCVLKSRDDWGKSNTVRQLVRCYIADEAVFVILDDEMHIPTLMSEANTVIHRLRPFAAAHTAMWKRSGTSPQLLVPL